MTMTPIRRKPDADRRSLLKRLAGGAAAASLPLGVGGIVQVAGAADRAAGPKDLKIVMDGHVHVTTRAYWEDIDLWKPQPAATGWNFAQARAGGVNCIIENLGTYTYWNYNYTPKHMLRLIENFHRLLEANVDKMGLALSVQDARRIVASGRMAVFLSVESGWDHEGDIDVLRAFYRLGLRSIQFSTQTEFNNLADSALTTVPGATHWNGLSPNGRTIVAEMNRLGMVIDIVHATPTVQVALIETSKAPVVASHVTAAAVSGAGGLSDEVMKSLAAKGGLVGIHGASAIMGKRYRAWVAANPDKMASVSAPFNKLVFSRPSLDHTPDSDNWGSYIEKFDAQTRTNWREVFRPFQDHPEAVPLVPTADEWAEQVDYVIKLIGADHVGIGLDMFGGRSGVLRDPSGYPDLLKALNRVTTPANVKKIAGENWLRVLGDIFSLKDKTRPARPRV
jgi:membrane dipeptidase